MSAEAVIGWDLGGAHLKAARLENGLITGVVQVVCPLWQGLSYLERALTEATEALGSARSHVVTMTGEMVDLFESRSAGVAALVDAMRGRFGDVRFYAGEEGFVSAERAVPLAMRLASANWMASAQVIAASMTDAMLVDIGSTTTDLVPVREGLVRARGRDDAARLEARELVYTGVVRTPVMALAEAVPFDGSSVPLMAELFATAADVHRLCGRLPPGADRYPPADNGEPTEAGSARRLARMIGRDADSRPPADWRRLAEWLADAQLRRIEQAAELLIRRDAIPPGAPIVCAGVGRFLAADLALRLGRPALDFAEVIGNTGDLAGAVSDCAPAAAVAWLSRARGAGVPRPG